MGNEHTVTGWLFKLAEGDEIAAQRLWELFSARMGQVARQRLRNVRTGAFDEDDVALSAFNNFCRGVQEGRWEGLGTRDDLWRLLAVITARKANQRIKEENRQKRGGDARRVSDVDWEDMPEPNRRRN